MKRILLLSLFLILGVAGFGQKFAFVDSDYILKKIPQYRAAQEQLDKLAGQYQKEVEINFWFRFQIGARNKIKLLYHSRANTCK